MKVNRSYIRECFKQEHIQLPNETLDDIVRHLRIVIGGMVRRTKQGKIKRLTPELLYIALGRLGDK